MAITRAEKLRRYYDLITIECDMLMGSYEYPPGTNRRYKDDGSPDVNVDELCRAAGFSEESASWVKKIRSDPDYQNEVTIELTRRKVALADCVLAQYSPVGRITARMVNELEARLVSTPWVIDTTTLLTMLPKWLTMAAKFKMWLEEGEDPESPGSRKKAYRNTQKAKQDDKRVAELVEATAEEESGALDDYPT